LDSNKIKFLYLTGEKPHSFNGYEEMVATAQPKVTTPFLRDVKLLKVEEDYYYVFLYKRSEAGE